MRKNHSSTIVVCCFVWTTMKPCSWRGGYAQLRAQSTRNPFTSVVTRSYVRNRIRKRRFCVRPSIIFLGRPFAPSSLYRIVRSLLLYRERTLLLIPSRNTFFFLGIRNSILSNTLLRPSGSDHWKHHRRECNETTMAMVNLAQEETKTEWNERKGQWKTKIQSPLTSWR